MSWINSQWIHRISTILKISDVEIEYTGNSGKVLQVNATEDGVDLGASGSSHAHANLSELDVVTDGDHDVRIDNPHSVTLAQLGGTTDHTELSNIGTNAHSIIDTHLGSTSNPHSVDASQIVYDGTETVEEILDDTINSGILDDITVTDAGGLNISWTAGEIFDVNTSSVIDTDSGSDTCANNTINYLIWTSGTTLTLGTTAANESSGEISVAIISAQDGDIQDLVESSIYNRRVSGISDALSEMFSIIVVNGLIVSEDVDGTNALDVVCSIGEYYINGYHEHEISAPIYSRVTVLKRHFHTSGAWDSDTNAEIDASNWDNGTDKTGTTASKYYRWLFLINSDEIYAIYPDTEYNTLASAITGSGPIVPPGLAKLAKSTIVIMKGNDAAFPTAGGNRWIDVRPTLTTSEAGMITDHGNLSGLTDDDHAQYHNNARGDARYYTETELDAGQLDNRYYTETELDAGQLDNRYFTEAEHLNSSAGAGDAGKPIKLDAAGHLDATMLNDADIDHASITSIGSNAHSVIDTHLGDGTKHFLEGAIDHTSILNIGSNAHSVIDTHLGSTSNPHSVTKVQVSLTNVQDTKVNLAASTAPTVTDDTNAGYSVGSLWVDTTLDTFYFCTDSSAGAALWVEGEIVDHGTLSGLSDDDHTQYLLANGSRGLSANWDVGSYSLTMAGLVIDTIGSNAILYAGAGSVVSGNTGKFVWDYTNERLGVGTGAPTAKLYVAAVIGTTDDVAEFNAAIGGYTATSMVASNSIGPSSAYYLIKCNTDSDGDGGGPFTEFSVRGDGAVCCDLLGLGTEAYGSSSDKVLAILNGTAPGSSPANTTQIYSADQTAGNACLHTRTEQGNIIKLYQQAHIIDADGNLADITTKFNTLLGYIENTGLLATS